MLSWFCGWQYLPSLSTCKFFPPLKPFEATENIRSCPNSSKSFSPGHVNTLRPREICPAGQYLSEAGCARCLAGQSISPVQCGKFTGTNGQCSNCVAGTFSHTVGAKSCTNCPVNTNSPAGSTICTACQSGFSSPAVRFPIFQRLVWMNL